MTSVAGSERYFSDWTEQTKQIATAVGKPAEGEELIDDVEAAYAKAAAEPPGVRRQDGDVAPG